MKDEHVFRWGGYGRCDFWTPGVPFRTRHDGRAGVAASRNSRRFSFWAA